MGLDSDPPDVDSLLADQRARWRRGDQVRVEDLLAARPGLRDHTEAVLDLIYAEVLLRRQTGDRPTVDEYLARFPALAGPLRAQFEVDAALGEGVTRAGGASLPSTYRDGFDGPAPPAPPGYEILEELGRGGMGVVYKARQRALDRLVALKVIRSGELADPEERARFEAEARAVARLSHANVVQIYEVGEAGGNPYLVLEYVAGGSLADLLQGPPFAARPAAALVATLARAVQHAHDVGVVHRDLKPANVLIQRAAADGQPSGAGPGPTGSTLTIVPSAGLGTSDLCPKLTDFGLAKHLGADGPTRTGDFLGTPNYTAPEQAVGRADVGPAADVYALGAILYHLVTGRPPFAGSTPLETLDQVRFAEPVPPSRLRPNLPKDLGTIILACLEKDPGRRYPTARALAEDLNRFLAGQSIRARAVGPVERAAKWARRRPTVAALAAFAVLLTVASLITVTALWRRATAARDAEQAERERDEARGAELLIANARYAWLTDDLDAARRALAETPPVYRDADWAYLDRACAAPRLVIPSNGSIMAALAYDAAGRRLAGISLNGLLVIWDAATGRVLNSTRAGPSAIPGQFHGLVFRPDGRLAVWIQSLVNQGGKGRLVNEFKLFDPDTGRSTGGWERPGDSLGFLSPDGRRAILIPKTDRAIILLDQESGEERHRLPIAPDDIVSATFSTDGKLLATKDRRNGLRAWDAETGALVRQFTLPGDVYPFNILALDAAGRRILGVVYRADALTELRVVEPDREVWRAPTNLAIVHGFALSPDGRLMAAFGREKVALPVLEVDTGRERTILRGFPAAVRTLTFSPDGRELAAAYQDGRIVLWNTAPLAGE